MFMVKLAKVGIEAHYDIYYEVHHEVHYKVHYEVHYKVDALPTCVKLLAWCMRR